MTNSIFKTILGCKSFTNIEFMAEEAIGSATGEDKKILEKILDTRKLDEIYAICHETLGEHDEAKKLRDFMKAKKARKINAENFAD